MAKMPLARVLRHLYRRLLQLRRVLWAVVAFLLSSLLSEQKPASTLMILPDHLLLFALLLLFGYCLELGLLVFVSRQAHSAELLNELAEEVVEDSNEEEAAKQQHLPGQP